jgi:hypothetical protein
MRADKNLMAASHPAVAGSNGASLWNRSQIKWPVDSRYLPQVGATRACLANRVESVMSRNGRAGEGRPVVNPKLSSIWTYFSMENVATQTSFISLSNSSISKGEFRETCSGTPSSGTLGSSTPSHQLTRFCVSMTSRFRASHIFSAISFSVLS